MPTAVLDETPAREEGDGTVSGSDCHLVRLRDGLTTGYGLAVGECATQDLLPDIGRDLLVRASRNDCLDNDARFTKWPLR
jgi:hypothetical protein